MCQWTLNLRTFKIQALMSFPMFGQKAWKTFVRIPSSPQVLPMGISLIASQSSYMSNSQSKSLFWALVTFLMILWKHRSLAKVLPFIIRT